MTPIEIVPLLGALGIGGAVTQLIVWLAGRRKEGADAAAVVTGAAREIVDLYTVENDKLRKEIAEIKEEMIKVRGDMHQVLDLVESERTWARTNGYRDAPVLRSVNGGR